MSSNVIFWQNKWVISSKKVAELFNRRHDNVALRARKLESKGAEGFFRDTEKAGRKYYMDQAGFDQVIVNPPDKSLLAVKQQVMKEFSERQHQSAKVHEVEVMATEMIESAEEFTGDQVQVFSYGKAKVRTVTKDGEVWFVAKDVCDILEINNPTNAMRRLEKDECTLILIKGSASKNLPVNAVNEYGFYSLVLGSRKSEAREFKRWVTHEVLPAIQKHGAYMTPETLEKALCDPDTIISIATNLKNEQLKRKAAEKALAIAQPSVAFVDQFINTTNTYTFRSVAKILGIKERAFISELQNRQYIYRQSGIILPFKYYLDNEYFTVKAGVSQYNGHNYSQTRITPKGVVWLAKKLKLSVPSNAIEMLNAEVAKNEITAA